MDAILRELELVIDRDRFDNGGLKIYTTIDGELQGVAEESLRDRLTQIESLPGFPHRPMKVYSTADLAGQEFTPYLEGAAIAIDSHTGGIRAVAGGRDYERSKFNRALLGRRQIGSSVKPFVYAKAFEAGLQPDDVVDDNRLRPEELPPAYGRYDPSNSDNTYRGELPAREGLVLSRNTMSVRIGLWTGLDPIREIIARANFTNPPRFPSLCLGASNQSEGFDRVLHSFRQRRGETAAISYRAHRRSGRADDLQSNACQARHPRPQSHQVNRFPDAGGPQPGHGIPGATTGIASHSRGKNRDHRRLPRRVVRRIRRSAGMRGLGRLRSAEKDHARRDGRRISSADLGGHHRGQTGNQMNRSRSPQIALRNKRVSNNVEGPLRRDDFVRHVVKIAVSADKSDRKPLPAFVVVTHARSVRGQGEGNIRSDASSLLRESRQEDDLMGGVAFIHLPQLTELGADAVVRQAQ